MAVQAASLPAGAKVVIEGNERLFPGQPLQPMPAGAAPAGKPEPGTSTGGGSPAAPASEER
jgi:hypothetical protein